jgi:hypothetical protein
MKENRGQLRISKAFNKKKKKIFYFELFVFKSNLVEALNVMTKTTVKRGIITIFKEARC